MCAKQITPLIFGCVSHSELTHSPLLSHQALLRLSESLKGLQVPECAVLQAGLLSVVKLARAEIVDAVTEAACYRVQVQLKLCSHFFVLAWSSRLHLYFFLL